MIEMRRCVPRAGDGTFAPDTLSVDTTAPGPGDKIRTASLHNGAGSVATASLRNNIWRGRVLMTGIRTWFWPCSPRYGIGPRCETTMDLKTRFDGVFGNIGPRQKWDRPWSMAPAWRGDIGTANLYATTSGSIVTREKCCGNGCW